MDKKIFPAKLLLFGEHTVVKGSEALAMAWPQYKGSWQYTSSQKGEKLQKPLFQLAAYLNNQASTNGNTIDTVAFVKELKRGLYFHSTIPRGFGVGSSGALCAAVFDRFGPKNHTYDWLELKAQLANIESFFHGSSSGLDPLICYTNQAFLVEGSNKLSRVNLPNTNKEGKGALFLLNTQLPRKTGPYVKLFLEKWNTPDFNEKCRTTLIPCTNRAIHSFLNTNWAALAQAMQQISYFQFLYLEEMIPRGFKQIWLDSLSTDAYHLKICGAGGGGFLLGMTKDYGAVKDTLAAHELQSVLRF